MNFEDHFVERKTIADQKDWAKTVVGFANSAPDGYPCVLFIGVKNDGDVETPQPDLDSAQKTLNTKLKAVYPQPPYIPKIVTKDGLQALAVIVLGSELRPHFSGPSYVRKGSETFAASAEQFNELIARRNSKANKILEYKGNVVTVVNVLPTPHGLHESTWAEGTTIADCNQFWVTFQNLAAPAKSSISLSRIDLNFDDANDRLKIEIRR
jgi:predicted HTH transcriptional regulator